MSAVQKHTNYLPLGPVASHDQIKITLVCK